MHDMLFFKMHKLLCSCNFVQFDEIRTRFQFPYALLESGQGWPPPSQAYLSGESRRRL